MTTPNDYQNGFQCIGWAAKDASGHLAPYKFTRRAPGTEDVVFKILYCGMCHAEWTFLKNALGHSEYPMVPGHEIVGVVTETGSNVTKFKKGQRVGVGTYVNSCQQCDNCNDDLTSVCLKKTVKTYADRDYDGIATAGGYSNYMIAPQTYVLSIPDKLPLDVAAPLLCAGLTVYSPMMRHGMNQPGKHLGVIGLGGLGHMAVKFGKAFGMKVTILSTSEGKREEAIRTLGADTFVATSDPKQVEAAKGTLDCIVDTASGNHPLDMYIQMLKTRGALALVGIGSELKFSPIFLCLGLKTIAGSETGGIKELQEMLNFCAEHNVTPMIEKIPIAYCNEAMLRMHNKDVRYRFVIDIENSLKE